MTTLSSMVSEVNRKLAGYTLRQDRQTYLTSDVSTTDLSITVKSAANISNGIIEIGNELIYVESYDRNTGVLTIPPYGRGYDGTQVSNHVANSKVTISPTFPSLDIKTAINETILSVFPGVYATNSCTFTYHAAQTTYTLPDEVQNVLNVTYEEIGPSKEWAPIRGWRIDRMSNLNSFDSNNSISIYSGVRPGRTVQVYYSAEPSTMENSSDDFESTTGLPTSCKDLIILGASYRLISFIDPSRLTFGSAESDQQSQIAGRSYGAGSNAAKYLLALYQQRLREETDKLQSRTPIRVHYTR
jgi:hypothetical protein